MNIAILQEQVHDMAVAKGWWDSSKVETPDGPVIQPSHERISSAIALVHSELSEALEEVRDDRLQVWHTDEGKPEGLPIELADALIRLLDLAGAMGIDMEEAIEIKVAYNARRQHRHGGRKL